MDGQWKEVEFRLGPGPYGFDLTYTLEGAEPVVSHLGPSLEKAQARIRFDADFLLRDSGGEELSSDEMSVRVRFFVTRDAEENPGCC